MKLRKALTALVAVSMTATAVAGISMAPAQADTRVDSGSLNWTVLTSWNNYIPMFGGTITPVAPSTANFVFPAESGSVASSVAADVQTEGGVLWAQPDHGITRVELSDLRVVVSGTNLTVYGDLETSFEGSFGDTPAGDKSSDDIPIATSTAATISTDGSTASIAATGLVVAPEAAAGGFPYAAGTPLDNLSLSVALDDTLPTPTPQISLSKTVVDPAGETITVTGTGFVPTDHPDALSTRQPITVGDFAGFYVVVGKFLDDWKPSEGAASSTRKTGSQQWAITEPIPSAIAGQAVVLNPDGSFTATLTAGEAGGSGSSAFDASTPGNYGIYTYGASGSKYAGYETYTPITFKQDAGLSLASGSAQTFGAPGALVFSANPAATGTVKVTVGGRSVTKALAGGTVSLPLPAGLAAGSYAAKVEYSGSAAFLAKTIDALPLTIAKAGATVTSAAVNSKYGVATSIVATLPSAATGQVNAKIAGKWYAGQVRNGRATIAVPANLAAGTHAVVLGYSGDANFRPATGATTIRVAKASPSLSLKWSTKPRVGKKSVLTVKVTGPATVSKPSGKASVTLKRGKKKVTVKAKTLKNGQVKLSVSAKQARALGKGKWTATVKYNGNSGFTTKTKSAKVSVK